MTRIAPSRLPNRLAAGLVAGSLLTWSGVAGAASAPDSFSSLAKAVAPAVVNIAATPQARTASSAMPDLPFEFPEGSPFEKFFKPFRDRWGQERGPRSATALGSGFIVDPDGYVVTNNHVVNEAAKVSVTLEDDSQYPAKVVGVDPQTDLALLKIDAGRPLPAVRFGDSDKAEVGDWVLAVGNPFGLGGSITAGIISARGRNIDAGPYDDFLQVDAPINRGNSGGPLFNMDGDVIGVNTAIFSPNGGNVGIGFSIPSNLAQSVVAQLKEKGKVERGWIGVQVQAVTPEIASALGLDKAEGALVSVVTPNSPAEEAGIEQGDVILRFAGGSIDGVRTLARQVADTGIGRKAEVVVWRDGSRKTLRVVTGRLPVPGAQAGASVPPDAAGGVFHSETLNADLAALTGARRAELDIPAAVTGVYVVDVKPGPVFDQGLRAGDIITRVAQQDVTTPREVEALAAKARSGAGRALLLLVNRNGNALFLGIRLGAA